MNAFTERGTAASPVFWPQAIYNATKRIGWCYHCSTAVYYWMVIDENTILSLPCWGIISKLEQLLPRGKVGCHSPQKTLPFYMISVCSCDRANSSVAYLNHCSAEEWLSWDGNLPYNLQNATLGVTGLLSGFSKPSIQFALNQSIQTSFVLSSFIGKKKTL